MTKAATSKTLLIMVASAFIISAALSGCSGKNPLTLETMLEAHPDAKAQIEKSVSAMENDEMKTQVAYDKNTIIVTGDLQTTYTDDVLKEIKTSFDESGYSKEDTFREVIDQIESTTKIDGVQIQLVINNGDGSKIWEKTYSN